MCFDVDECDVSQSLGPTVSYFSLRTREKYVRMYGSIQWIQSLAQSVLRPEVLLPSKI
jgi:hypothetical protein